MASALCSSGTRRRPSMPTRISSSTRYSFPRITTGLPRFDTNAQGLIDRFTVMVRPLSAALAVRDSIGAQLGATP